jgi:hypothetical protein
MPIGHCSSRIRESLFCSAKLAPYRARAGGLELLPGRAKIAASTLKDGIEDSSDWSLSMKTILSALVALSVIAGVAGSASALDSKSFYEHVDRNHY